MLQKTETHNSAVLSLPVKNDHQVNTLEDADHLFCRIFGFPKPDFTDRKQVCILYLDDNMMLLKTRTWHVSEFRSIGFYFREMVQEAFNCSAKNIMVAHFSPLLETKEDSDNSTEMLCDNYHKLAASFKLVYLHVSGYLFYDRQFKRTDIECDCEDSFI